MPPVVNRNSLPVLNGAGPLVIFGEADGEAVRQHGGSLDADVFLYRPANDGEQPGRLRELNESGPEELVELHMSPSAPCVMACLTAEGERQLGELLAWWSGFEMGSTPDIVRLPAVEGRSGEHVWQPLYERLLREVIQERTDAARRETQTRAELVDLRYEYEQTRAAMEKLESLMNRLRLAPWRLAVALEPGEHVYWPATDAMSHVPQLTQPFPESAEGLAGFDLYLASDKPSAKRRGVLRVSLRAMDENRVLGRWQVPYDSLAPGWFRFAFDRALKEPFHDLRLSVSWQSESGGAPGLAFSPTEAWPDVHAMAGGESLGRSLAMRIWRGLPGLRLSSRPPGPREALLVRENADEFEYELGVRDYDRVCETTVGASEDHFSRLEGGIGFRLHPSPPFGKPTSTIMLRACGEGVTQVVGTALIAHPECKSEIEFALCLTDSAVQCPRIPEDLEGDDRVLASSGWIRVPPDGKPHVIVVPLQAPLRSPADLHFATRVPFGGSFEWAWADWLKVAVCLRSPRQGLEVVTEQRELPQPEPVRAEDEPVDPQQRLEPAGGKPQDLEGGADPDEAMKRVENERDHYVQELERVNAWMVEQRAIAQRILDQTEDRAIRAEQELQLYKTPFLRRTLRRIAAQAKRSEKLNTLVRRIVAACRGG